MKAQFLFGGDTIHTFDKKGKTWKEGEQKGSAAASICGAVTSGLDAAIRSGYYGARENEARGLPSAKVWKDTIKRGNLNNALESIPTQRLARLTLGFKGLQLLLKTLR